MNSNQTRELTTFVSMHRRRAWRRRSLALLEWLGLLWCCLAQALPANQTIDQFHHSSWTLRDGAPPDAYVLVQAADGALWLGTMTGLFRFDGVRFERIRSRTHGSALSSDISALWPTPEGALWIGMRSGGVFLLEDGELTDYRIGLPPNTVYGLVVDRDGIAWAGTTRGLFRRDHDRWQQVGADWGFQGAFVTALHLDRDGTLWSAGPAGVQTLARGSRRFAATNVKTGLGYLTETPSREIWFSGDARLFSVSRAIDDPSRAAPGLSPSGGTGSILADRDGGLWFVLNGGLGRIADPARLSRPDIDPMQAVETPDPAQHLSGEFVRTIFEDRGGNLWVATNGGLDQFRVPKLNALNVPLVAEATLAETPDGVMWAGTAHGGLRRLDAPARAVWNAPEGTTVTALHAAASGALWIGTTRGLYVREHDVVSAFALPTVESDPIITAIDTGPKGELWISIVRAGLFRWQAGEWSERGSLTALPEREPSCIAFEDHGRMWLGYRGNLVALVEEGRVRQFDSQQGLESGDVQTILSRGELVLIGGSAGIARFKDGRFVALRGSGEQRFEGTSGLVFAPDGSLWINSAAGVSRIAAKALDAWSKAESHAVEYELLDHHDGLRGIATQMRPVPSAFRDSTGKLWFSTSRDVHWIDPARIPRNPHPPTVELHSLSAHGEKYAWNARTRLPVGTSQIEIEYGAVSLSIPEKVRFRYRLDGLQGGDWQDAGTRRTAYFTNLHYGHYRFEVVAANEDGLWSTQGTRIEIEIPPAFYETGWFRTLAALLLLFMAWLLYRLRLRQLEAQLRSRIQARTQEREVIAREMHDTLLQSTQGLILAFGGLARKLPPSNDTRLQMERTLDRAETILDEGRDLLLDLRSLDTASHDLSRALTLVAEELSETAPTNLRTLVGGTPRTLARRARVEAYRIGREAIVNAFTHAQAKLIEIDVQFHEDHLTVSVRDDGRGIEHEILAAGGRSRHWGLKGMRERAAELGAELCIRSEHGVGTQIELTIPGSIAYAHATLRRRWWQRIAPRLFRSSLADSEKRS